MAAKNIHVTDTELAVLEVLWQQPQATIRQITGKLYGQGTNSEYATVQKLLERLERKRCVRRDRSEFAHSFTAKISRADLIDRRLQDVADKLAGGSWTPLLTHLVDGGRLSEADRKRLRKLIDDASAPKRRQGGSS